MAGDACHTLPALEQAAHGRGIMTRSAAMLLGAVAIGCVMALMAQAMRTRQTTTRRF